VLFCDAHAPGQEAPIVEAVAVARPMVVEAVLLQAVRRVERDELDAALTLFDAGLASRLRPDGRVWRAVVRARLGRVEQAQTTLAQLSTDAEAGAIARANLEVLRGTVGDGAGARNRALASLVSGSAAGDMAGLEPRLRGAALLMRGDAAGAVAELKDAADAASLNNAGVALAELGRVAEARERLNRAVSAGGAEVVRRAVLANRARVRLAAEDAEGAERDATAAMAAGDESAEVRRVRAGARARLGRASEAEADEAEARARSGGAKVGMEWRGRVVVEGAPVLAARMVLEGEDGRRVVREGAWPWEKSRVAAAHDLWRGK
jgi:tetratricopeptide (TPR) repeat protein